MRLTLLLLASVTFVTAVCASQGPGHIYVALKAYEQSSPAVQALIDADRDAYLAGATGPDICLTTWLIAEGLGYEHPGSEAHYQATGKIITTMLRRAAKNPDAAERNRGIAFALGWLTHFCTDNVVHPLVNQFGGYFGAGGEYITRHKHLELVECEHVFRKNFGNLDSYAINAGAVPTVLITATFNEVFPNNIVYKPITQYTALAFNDDLKKSAGLMQGATSWLLNCHRQGWSLAGPVFSTVMKGYPPDGSEYEALMEPLRIDSVELEEPDRANGETEGKLVVKYDINDLRLFKLFCKAWDRRIGSAAGTAANYFSTYAADPASFKLPDINLDTGMPIGQHFDPNTASPGRPDIYQMLGFVGIKDPEGKDISPLDKTGQWIPIPFTTPGLGGDNIGTIETRKGWNEGLAGKAFIKIPFDCSKAGEYNASVRLVFADKRTKEPFMDPDKQDLIEATWSGSLSGKPELSILFLVDGSGSMGGGKLAAAIAAVKDSVDQTNDGKTEWCLLRYGGCGVHAICRFTMDPNKLKAAADQLTADGDTPLTYGREKALWYLTQRGRGAAGRMIILCDGQDNCPERGGITQPEAAAQLQKLMRIVTPAQMPGGQGGTP